MTKHGFSQQLEVYKSIVHPLIDEVLAGYNCTVFAYGQTGTGKTYTMEGGKSTDNLVSWEDVRFSDALHIRDTNFDALFDSSWFQDPSSGIIPRSLSHLFDELRLLQAEYTVRVSFLELYNEEIFDLLSPTDDATKLRCNIDSYCPRKIAWKRNIETKFVFSDCSKIIREKDLLSFRAWRK